MIRPGLIIGIDFDGTCVTHEFPKIGKELPHCVETLKKIIASGGKLILWTMRSNHQQPAAHSDEIHTDPEDYLDHAIQWFKDRDIPLWGINENPEQKSWTHSPKAYCHVYIDDAALGAHITHDPKFSNRSYVDWAVVDAILFP